MHDCLGQLSGVVQSYAWGSSTALAALQGRAPSGGPEAELWFGAHPSAPSTLYRQADAVALDALIAASPSVELGPHAAALDGYLPFLVKVLAAESPLSLQVHPNDAQARAGFADEEARGVARDAPDRRFRDAWPKPELIIALEQFEALCGFLPAAAAREVLGAVGGAPFDAADALLAAHGDDAWPHVVETLLSASPVDVASAVEHWCANPPQVLSAAVVAWLQRLATVYPADPALLIVPLMIHRQLAAGEALALEPGNVHAYLGGLAVEVMANSDNVLRGGLTNKHVDIAAFTTLLDGRLRPNPQRPAVVDDAYHYASPSTLFDVAAYSGAIATSTQPAPQIWLCVDGSATLRGANRTVSIGSGDAAFICAATPPVQVAGAGMLFRVTDGVGGA